MTQRNIGVRNSTTMSTEQAPSDTLVKLDKVETYIAYYGDASGRAHISTFLRIDGKWFESANGEMWANSLKPLTRAFQKQADDRAASLEPLGNDVPKDTVDVMGR